MTNEEKAAVYCMRLEQLIADKTLLAVLQSCVRNHFTESREQRLERLVDDIYHSRFFDGDAALEDEDLDLVSRMRHEIK